MCGQKRCFFLFLPNWYRYLTQVLVCFEKGIFLFLKWTLDLKLTKRNISLLILLRETHCSRFGRYAALLLRTSLASTVFLSPFLCEEGGSGLIAAKYGERASFSLHFLLLLFGHERLVHGGGKTASPFLLFLLFPRGNRCPGDPRERERDSTTFPSTLQLFLTSSPLHTFSVLFNSLFQRRPSLSPS